MRYKNSAEGWYSIEILTSWFFLFFSEPVTSITTKEIISVPGQFDDAVENGKTVEKGQGDAPLVTS